jgi:hypothetical protein
MSALCQSGIMHRNNSAYALVPFIYGHRYFIKTALR